MNEAARVALAIVKEHFGEACRLVFATLVARESTLKQVAEGSGLPLAQARESLTWLLQHDVITFTAQPQKSFSDKPGPNVYRTIVWRVLQRARIPRMLHYTAKNHGDLEESIVQVIASWRFFFTVERELTDRVVPMLLGSSRTSSFERHHCSNPHRKCRS
eukprot:m.96041 g.96041  ORF g.96041 m.96041 type:complete len:160 (-) comp12348_c0_seq1:1214-1693(-)